MSKKAIACIALVVTLVSAYVAGGLLFSAYFMPGTRLNGQDASWMSPAKLANAAEEASEGFSTRVTSVDGAIDLAIDGAKVGFSFRRDDFEREVRALLPGWKWPLTALRRRSFEVTQATDVDARAIETLVRPAVEQANAGAIPPAPASVMFDEDTGAFVAVDTQVGTLLDVDRCVEAVRAGIAMVQPAIELGRPELARAKPSTSDPGFDAAVERANQTAGLTLDLLIHGERIFSTDPCLMHSWITIDESCAVMGDLDAITTWAQHDFSDDVDTVGRTRTFARADDGKEVTVAGGTYGWNVDGAALAQVICQRIRDNSAEPIEVPMQTEGAVWSRGGADWLRYVDVDLSEQWVRMFDEDGELIWASECVTGNLALAQNTVEGVFALEGKMSPAVLVGLDEDGDGKPDYETDVTYWMPFYGGYGLHDALWRSYFGGDEHLYNGSHGCVNLPYYAAESLFELVSIGDPVVVHW